MIFILGGVFSSTLIYILFKVAKNFQTNIPQLIAINYLTAGILGLVIFNSNSIISSATNPKQIFFAAIVGILFIVMFFLIGESSQKAGITVTSLANKISLVFPVIFSIIYFNETITVFKIVGFVLAFLSIGLTVYKKGAKKNKNIIWLLPLFIFLGSGITDSTVKYAEAEILNNSNTALFSSQVFWISFLLAMLFIIIKKQKIIPGFATLTIGIFLGIANFGSLYYLINALKNSGLESSLVFTTINISIVSLSAIVGTIVFKERLSVLNYFGILLALLSLYFLIS